MRKNNTDNENKILDLGEYRRSPSPGACASKPKYHIVTPKGSIYFKFGLTNNEICAEILSCQIAAELDIAVAVTKAAKYKQEIGIASFDIGCYQEPDDSVSYSIKDYLGVNGFIQMCLFDYLIMNEDRHAGNWGIVNNEVALLFDHNNCFGGEDGFIDADQFMLKVTSSFYTDTEYKQRHDMILQFISEEYPKAVTEFIDKVNQLPELSNGVLNGLMPDDYAQIKRLLEKRIEYMNQKVGEFIV
jgi:hypothetical protein